MIVRLIHSLGEATLCQTHDMCVCMSRSRGSVTPSATFAAGGFHHLCKCVPCREGIYGSLSQGLCHCLSLLGYPCLSTCLSQGVTPVCPPVRPRGYTPVYSFFGPTGRVCPEASYVGKGALMPRAEIWVLWGDDAFTTPHLRAGLLKFDLFEAVIKLRSCKLIRNNVHHCDSTSQ